uniref:Uncharacterized protein n=1 Tax=Cacopsylla melanoneura TaxID=428564 RepID=A0A8D8Y1A0_9HEMI
MLPVFVGRGSKVREGAHCSRCTCGGSCVRSAARSNILHRGGFRSCFDGRLRRGGAFLLRKTQGTWIELVEWSVGNGGGCGFRVGGMRRGGGRVTGQVAAETEAWRVHSVQQIGRVQGR